jgi:hypothetical protein
LKLEKHENLQNKNLIRNEAGEKSFFGATLTFVGATLKTGIEKRKGN